MAYFPLPTFYSIPQEKFKKYTDRVSFYAGWSSPDLQPENLRKKSNLLICVDDTLDSDHVNNEFIKSIFLKDGHHRQWSIIATLHDLFDKSIKNLRSCLLNTQYFYLTNSPRSISSLRYFLQQCFPAKCKKVLSLYEDLMKKQFAYLWIDMSARTNNKLRLRSNIFPPEKPTIVYLID